jgi:signal transduction histidine kinase/CheY-like chemotaxis protein
MTPVPDHGPTPLAQDRASSPTIDDRVRREQARIAVESSRSSDLLSLPAALLICWVLWDSVDVRLLLGWLALKTATTGWRVVVAHRFKRSAADESMRWARRFEPALAADGLTYGLLAPIVATASSTLLTVIMTATVLVVAAVGLVVLSSNLRTTLLFVLPVSLPLFPPLLAQGDNIALYLAAGSAVFLGVVVVEGARAAAHTAAMLRLRFQMDEIAAQRAQALDLAERSNAAKSRFLATMSHEMRTPLHGILGLARLLRPVVQAHPLDAARLQMLERTGEHLLGLISDVLDHSRIEDGRLELVTERFDLKALLRSVADLARVAAGEKGLALVEDLAALGPDEPAVWVVGDASRLRQILLNLLGNAVKFTDAGQVTVRATRAGDATVVDVIDTGIGIADADRERIFGAFEQADSSYARRHGGSGLGLTISRELARGMGGDITCRPQPGGGTVFRFTVDLPDTAAPASMDAPGRPGVPLQGRVLLAEDNPVNALVAEALLVRQGLEVAVASDGHTAVVMASRERFQLILMDVQMPELDGFEAAARIRAMEQAAGHPRTPIVAVTANALPSDRSRSLAAGMDDHLAKPLREGELEAVLARYLAPVG